jgi:hypothetical protein
MAGEQSIVRVRNIEKRIFEIRGQRVMFDSDLAELYGVSTKRLNEQVKRNKERFPPDFMFRLSYQELRNLRSQFATSSLKEHSWGGKRILPYVFTEHGAVMLASVINSLIAVNTSIQIVRAFIQIREMAVGYAELSKRINSLEKKYDAKFKVVFEVFRELMKPAQGRKKIGFRKKETSGSVGLSRN